MTEDTCTDCCPDHRYRSTVPRVATSLDDLRVGQWVAWYEKAEEQWMVMEVMLDGDELSWEFTGTEVILADPKQQPEPVTVSRAAFDRLAEARHDCEDIRRGTTYSPESERLMAAARALVDEVRGADA